MSKKENAMSEETDSVQPGLMKRTYDFATRTTFRKIASGLFALSTITGTFRGIEGGLSPIYTIKTGNSYGANVGLVTWYKDGATHTGLDISLIRIYDGGNLNGIGLSFCSGTPYSKERTGKSKLNGLEIGFLNLGSACEKFDLVVNGAQIGAINLNNDGYNLQAGLVNGRNTAGNFHAGMGIGFNSSEPKK